MRLGQAAMEALRAEITGFLKPGPELHLQTQPDLFCRKIRQN